MRYQLPTSLSYILLFEKIHNSIKYYSDDFFSTMIVPGVLMTPVSAMMEIFNTKHGKNNIVNIVKKSRYGTTLRLIREISFGVGLFYTGKLTENITYGNKIIENLLSSLVCGFLVGYTTHLPNILSLMKIENNEKSYRHQISNLIKFSKNNFILRSINKIIDGRINQKYVNFYFTMFFPKSIHYRCIQTIGCFFIISMFKDIDQTIGYFF